MSKMNNRINLVGLGGGYTTTTNWLTFIALGIAAASVFFMSVSVTVDVFLRYVFNAPSVWVTEVAGYLLGVMVLLGLAYAQREKAHVRVDIIVSMLPAAARRWLHLVTLVVFLALTITLGYLFARNAVMSIVRGSTSETVLDIVVGPWQAVYPIGCLVLALVLIRDIYTAVVEIRGQRISKKAEEELPEF